VSFAFDSRVPVAALFVTRGGFYSDLPSVDAWDVSRDARLYRGPSPVVAHPPCARWCRLAELVASLGGARPGDDEGCFASALASVRRWGGVLEHPAWSKAWPAFGLLTPSAKGWTRDLFGDGWVCEVSQAAYGHRAPKLTWLYYVGANAPFLLNWSRPACAMTTTTSRRTNGKRVEMQCKAERSATPPAFGVTLLALAQQAISARRMEACA
jgi:hypothetical protein